MQNGTDSSLRANRQYHVVYVIEMKSICHTKSPSELLPYFWNKKSKVELKEPAAPIIYNLQAVDSHGKLHYNRELSGILRISQRQRERELNRNLSDLY